MSGQPKISEEFRAAVETVLSRRSDCAIPPKRVHELVGYGALITVRHALRELVQEERVGYIGPDCGRLYFSAR